MIKILNVCALSWRMLKKEICSRETNSISKTKQNMTKVKYGPH